MKKIFVTLILLFLFQSGFSQYSKSEINPSYPKVTGSQKSTPQNSTCAGLLIPVQTLNSFRQSVIHLGIENDGPDQEIIESIKKEKLKTKVELPAEEESSGFKTSSLTPVLGTNFLGNMHNGYTPPDNSMAISNGGYIVTATNSTLKIMNTSGTTFYDDSFTNFFNSASLTGSIYDPVVIYDSGADRFVLVVLHGNSSSTSKVLVCFSKSNNPNDGWWMYSLTGNPRSNSCWFDYPKLAVSNNEIYVTGNLFLNSGSFSEAVIYQINKNDGYSGGSLNWQYWYNLTGSPFTLMPVSWGQSGNYGPGVLLVSQSSSSGSSFKLYNLTDYMTGSPTIDDYTINTSAYSVGADAAQAGSANLLNTGDCRMLSGFYLDDIIHFVFHSDIGSGWNGINYNRLTLSTLKNVSKTFGLSGTFDYCYPSVTSFATSTSDPSVLIGFQRSGSSIYPEARVVSCDNSMTFSGSIPVKTGSGGINILGSLERWGDYTGISRKHNALSPTAWVGIGYGNSSNVYSSWIAEVNSMAIGIEDEFSETSPITVFPNPVLDMFTIEFDMQESADAEINIYDQQGKLITCLYKDRIMSGSNRLSFNKNALSSGIYFLSIQTNQNTIHNEKIIISD